jgi:hypothetical protein
MMWSQPASRRAPNSRTHGPGFAGGSGGDRGGGRTPAAHRELDPLTEFVRPDDRAAAAVHASLL